MPISQYHNGLNMKSLDDLFHREYCKDTYNCSHFVCEAYEIMYGKDISEDLSCFLLPEKKRFADKSIKNKFKIVNDLKNGDIIVYHKVTRETHVGIVYNRKIMHITHSGVQLMHPDIVKIGFIRSKVYRYAK